MTLCCLTCLSKFPQDLQVESARSAREEPPAGTSTSSRRHLKHVKAEGACGSGAALGAYRFVMQERSLIGFRSEFAQASILPKTDQTRHNVVPTHTNIRVLFFSDYTIMWGRPSHGIRVTSGGPQHVSFKHFGRYWTISSSFLQTRALRDLGIVGSCRTLTDQIKE